MVAKVRPHAMTTQPLYLLTTTPTTLPKRDHPISVNRACARREWPRSAGIRSDFTCVMC
jgi:hypothetical protein